MHSIAQHFFRDSGMIEASATRGVSPSEQADQTGARLSVLQARNDERRQIARELHDGSAQLLLELEFELAALERQRTGWSGDNARKIISRLQEQMRCISYVLHPPELEKFGLVGALEALTLGMEARTGIAISFKARGYRKKLMPEMELAVLRIAQEALMNVFKHSGSKRAEVRLHCSCNWLCLRVRDFGIGHQARDAIASGLGVGLQGMATRIAEVGGQIRLRPLDGGLAVTALVRNPLGMCTKPVCAPDCSEPIFDR